MKVLLVALLIIVTCHASCERFVNDVKQTTDALLIRTPSFIGNIVDLKCPYYDVTFCNDETQKNFLVNLLVQGVPTSDICTPPQEITSTEENGAVTCTVCIAVLEMVKHKLKDEDSVESLLHVLEKSCDYVPKEGKATCKMMVTLYGRQILESLIAGLPTLTICQRFSLCQVTVESSTDCFLCTFVMDAVLDKIKSDDTKEKVLEVLSNACSYVPQDFRPTCIAMMEDSGSKLLELILAGLSSTQICQVMRLCPVKTIYTLEDDPNSITCSGCKFVMGAIEDKLKSERTREGIINVVGKVCLTIKRSDYKELCDYTVKTYATELIDLFMARIQHDKICMFLKLCKPPAYELTQPQSVDSKANNSLCNICHSFIELANSGKDNVEKSIQKLKMRCSTKGHRVQQFCYNLLEDLEVLLRSMDGLDPNVCDSIGIC
ncbi:hypothetical protein RCL1_005451 [Eukaryota sp. TZLM3-RCL]